MTGYQIYFKLIFANKKGSLVNNNIHSTMKISKFLNLDFHHIKWFQFCNYLVDLVFE